MHIKDIPNWCAASKISGLDNHHKPTLKKILKLWEDNKHQSSVLIVSVGEDQPDLDFHLKTLGFKKMRSVINYGHSSHKTWLRSYQIPKKLWCQVTGYNGKGNWTTINEKY